MQAWVSCSEGRTTACGPHALGGARCGERGTVREHSETNRQSDGVARMAAATPERDATLDWKSPSSFAGRRSRCGAFLRRPLLAVCQVFFCSLLKLTIWPKMITDSDLLFSN